jgi:Rrf2 family protein
VRLGAAEAVEPLPIFAHSGYDTATVSYRAELASRGGSVEVSRRTDYALRILLELGRSEGKPVSVRTIASRQDVPYSFARGIGSDLVSAGLAESSRGVNGGLVLARNAEEISVLDVVEAMQGPISCALCTNDPSWCKRMNGCSVHRVWSGADELLKAYLGSKSLGGLLESEGGR